MMYAFGMGYKTEEPTIVDMNMDEIYRQNIELLKLNIGCLERET